MTNAFFDHANRTESTWRDACAAALVSLPDSTPVRLRRLLDDNDPAQAWERLGSGDLGPDIAGVTPATFTKWRSYVRRTEPLAVMERYVALGITVLTRYDKYPSMLRDDPFAPAVLFARGDVRLLQLPSAGIVGTRRCSPVGRRIAETFGRELAEHQVAVVSGLALGIDAAAHRGVLSSLGGVGPIAVVGSGLDVIYPKRNEDLWNSVIEDGVLLSEAPLGAAPEAWRFPARNRILAGLSHVVLVIESHERGGSLITVDEAISRCRPVLAVPGSIRAPANSGTNQLIRDGAVPALCSQDVADEALAQFAARFRGEGDELPHLLKQPSPDLTGCEPDAPAEPLPEGDEGDVLAAIDWNPTSTEDVLVRTGFSLGVVAQSLVLLERWGWIEGEEGWWWRRD